MVFIIKGTDELKEGDYIIEDCDAGAALVCTDELITSTTTTILPNPCVSMDRCLRVKNLKDNYFTVNRVSRTSDWSGNDKSLIKHAGGLTLVTLQECAFEQLRLVLTCSKFKVLVVDEDTKTKLDEAIQTTISACKKLLPRECLYMNKS